ncbi:hypothetical protein J3B02_002247 [Coemansia erecta]|uniref:Uncharacterized protein n=1 Tax=Coemansia asiatica TaxID=1052880 RepID=A0A9W7XGD2_9FUNG|nr:hypothetical protein LPJ64_005494 [Coemansia asiatica]KAJ2855293.1 hypothetical protein J3B02_002247 [Coemansia erecta]KAJ2883007.1 hypothetical protein FB639_002264 [Coemansia asiatica]
MAIGDLSAEVERRNQYSGVLVAELDTQMHELLAATRALAAVYRNSVFDLGIAGVTSSEIDRSSSVIITEESTSKQTN